MIVEIFVHYREILYLDPKERMETEGLPVKVINFLNSILITIAFSWNNSFQVAKFSNEMCIEKERDFKRTLQIQGPRIDFQSEGPKLCYI